MVLPAGAAPSGGQPSTPDYRIGREDSVAQPKGEAIT